MKLCVEKMSRGVEVVLESIGADKSISHRCAMFSLLANAPCEVHNFLMGEDTLHTLEIAKNLGLGVESLGDSSFRLTPPEKIAEPSVVLDCGNAGTAMRLYLGLLAAQDGQFILSGDKYLNARPMARVIAPLTSIGADITARENNKFAPICVRGRKLKNFTYESPISSAQVKSAMILAALNAQGECHFSEPLISRDHTEKMLTALGADIKVETSSQATAPSSPYTLSISPLAHKLESFNIRVPADPSSAFFFAVAACVAPHKCVVSLKSVLLNPTRIEAFKVLEKMGAKIAFMPTSTDLEAIGDIIIESAPLRGVMLDSNISWLIDEIPALAVAMAVAKGKSVVKNAKELRVKESDRITATLAGLRAFGIECVEFEDGFEITGGELKTPKTPIDSYGDHRIAMSFAVAALACGGEIADADCIAVSFPNFVELLSRFTQVAQG